ncbi:hypothetical protein SBV1_180016 [Verrucomicrobia bacterium]|nr:hypothetical protein SBV1_180016 [Verrucomicrobiota bacterium]
MTPSKYLYIETFTLPTNCEAVDKAVSAESLKAAASRTTDPQVLLGLAFLAEVGSPVRQEISGLAVKARPDYAPIATILAIGMDGPNEESISELIKRDPNNALGYYLLADRLYHSAKENESLDAFRKAAACPELRLYGSVTTEALFKALNALNLTGRNRLAALSWMATRMHNFYIGHLQNQTSDLTEMARKADLPTRKEISGLLLVLAGHLFATNFQNRHYAEWAAHAALQLKAKIAAAEQSPTTNGYVAAVQALTNAIISWPGIEERRQKPLEVAQFLPSRIWDAVALVGPSQMTAVRLVEMIAKVPDSDKAAFEQAKEDAVKAAAALIDVSVTDPDTIIGAYLQGLPPPRANNPGPWVASPTYVEKLMSQRPEVFKAAAAFEVAVRAVYEARSADPQGQNVHKLMGVGLAIFSYAADHNRSLPGSLELLFENGKYLKGADEARSVLSGKPYVYPAAGETLPEKSYQRNQFILLYDDTEQDGSYQCVMGDGRGESRPGSKVREQLLQRGK